MKSREFEPPHREIVVIAHNIRSVLNVGAILRTAEGFGVEKVFATGWTPNLEYSCHCDQPPLSSRAQSRDLFSYQKLLPHVSTKLAKELHKTALGAEEIISFQFHEDVFELIAELRRKGFLIVGLEQDPQAIPLPKFQPPAKIVLLLGEEVGGLTPELREICDQLVEIPMFGRKESFNVSVATGIVLYEMAQRRPSLVCATFADGLSTEPYTMKPDHSRW